MGLGFRVKSPELYKRKKHIKVHFQNVRSSGLKDINKACYKKQNKKLTFKTQEV
jgi:hypothetical protein